MPSTSCPSIVEIELAVAGGDESGEATRVRRHAEDCPRCSRLARVVRRNNELASEWFAPLHSPAATAPPMSDDAGAPPRDLGEFQLLDEVGRGGMGVVYAARQVPLRREVALKVLPSQFSALPDVVARFRREATTAARLDHPGIVEIYTVGESGGTYFFAMELLRGAPLDAILQQLAFVRDDERDRTAGASAAIRGDALAKAARAADSGLVDENLTGDGRSRSPDNAGTTPATSSAADAGVSDAPYATLKSRTHVEAACSLAVQIADALAYAHEHGVIHRDVKPSNVIVRRDGRAVLTDFGLARDIDLPALSRTGAFAGTPYYVSPEQAAARPVDARTDVFSLGVTLFEMVLLRRPFEGESTQEVLGKIASEDAPAPRTLDPSVPRDLDTILQTALARNPERRYCGAAALAEDLRRFLAYRPILARPAGRLERAAKLARRRPAVTAATAVAVVVTIAVLAFAIFTELRDRQRFHTRLAAAKDAAESGDPAAALRLVQDALAIDPTDPLAQARRDRYADDAARLARLDDARDQVASGRLTFARYRELAHEIASLETEIDSLRTNIAGHEGPDVKRPLWHLEARLDETRRARSEQWDATLRSLHGALMLAGESYAEGRRALADVYHERFVEWDRLGEIERAMEARVMVERFDVEDRYRDSLDAPGTVSITTSPPGATVHVYRYVARDHRLHLEPWANNAAIAGDHTADASPPDASPPDAITAPSRSETESGGFISPSAYTILQHARGSSCGQTPLTQLELPAGSYLLWIALDDHVPVRYPLRVERGVSETMPTIRLWREHEHPGPDRWVQIPAGSSLLGGDPGAFDGWDARVVEVPEFFMARFEVTVAEYREFLEDEHTVGRYLRSVRKRAPRYAPRPANDPPWRFDEDTRTFEIPREWGDPRRPIQSISWFDAGAYVDWLNRRAEERGEPFTYALPSEIEWARAARGADGRAFPWGNGFDWSFLNAYRSRSGGPYLEIVGTFPADESPFGVRDLAGGVREFTSDWYVDSIFVATRGGTFSSFLVSTCRAASRNGFPRDGVRSDLGFRVVCRPD